MPRKVTPSQHRLRELFDYDPKTGLFSRRVASARKPAGSVIKPTTAARYHSIRVDGTTYFAHRLVWKYVHGEDAETLDHINGKTRDNRIANLRSVTYAQNAWNRTQKVNSNAGELGVFKAFGGTVWRARIKTPQGVIHIGPFKTVAEATAARNQLIPLYRGEYHRKEN